MFLTDKQRRFIYKLNQFLARSDTLKDSLELEKIEMTVKEIRSKSIIIEIVTETKYKGAIDSIELNLNAVNIEKQLEDLIDTWVSIFDLDVDLAYCYNYLKSLKN